MRPIRTRVAGPSGRAGATLDQLLTPETEYVKLQIGAFHRVMDAMEQEAQAPLEYPLGPIDLVGEYFVLHSEPVATDAAAIGAALAGREWRVTPAEGVPAFSVGTAEAPTTKVLQRADGKLQCWNIHGYAAWSECARITLDVARHLAASLETGLLFADTHPVTGELEQWLDARVDGLGVDMYLAVNERFPLSE